MLSDGEYNLLTYLPALLPNHIKQAKFSTYWNSVSHLFICSCDLRYGIKLTSLVAFIYHTYRVDKLMKDY